MSETVIIEVILDRHDDEVIEAFGRAMASIGSARTFLITGDYLIKVAVNGTAGYEEFLRRKL